LSFVFPDQKSAQALLQKVDAQFERGADGKTVFYPGNNHRIGYVIDPPEREQALRTYTLRYKKIGRTLAPFAAALVPLYGYVIAPKYPWWLTVAYGFGGLAAMIIPFWLWARTATMGLIKIGEAAPLSRKHWMTLAVIGATLIFISLYQPVADPTLLAGAIAFYPDVGDPILVMLFGVGMAFIIYQQAARLREKMGATRYGLVIGLFVLFALGGFGRTLVLLIHPRPQILVTPTALSCDEGQVAWQHVIAISPESGGSAHDYAKVTLDTVNPFLQDRTFNCEIDGTGAGYVAVYNAIETAWQKAKDKPAP
jgi:hypothetical protein